MVCGIPRCPGWGGWTPLTLREGARLSACLPAGDQLGGAEVHSLCGTLRAGQLVSGRGRPLWTTDGLVEAGCCRPPSDGQAPQASGPTSNRKWWPGTKHTPSALTGAAGCRQLGPGAPPRAAAAPGQPGALPDPLQGGRGAPVRRRRLPQPLRPGQPGTAVLRLPGLSLPRVRPCLCPRCMLRVEGVGFRTWMVRRRCAARSWVRSHSPSGGIPGHLTQALQELRLRY